MQLFQKAGAQSNKPPKWESILSDRLFTGYYPNRAPLGDTADPWTTHAYIGGRTDSIWDDGTGTFSKNIELTNRLTLQRRPGLSNFSTFQYPTPPLRAFRFELSTGAVQILVDTEAALYLDNLDGTATLLFSKVAGAGQTYGVSVGDIFYFSDGKSGTFKYTPLNANNSGIGNGQIWNWQGSAPLLQPNVSETPSGSAASVWAASTVFTPMGLLKDSNGNAEFLISVNAGGSNSTAFGKTGNGEPNWSQTPGTTTSDNTVTWTNIGPCVLWTAATEFQSGLNGTTANPSLVYDPISNSVYIQSSGSLCLSGGKKPNFTGVFGSKITDGNSPNACVWICIGTPKQGASWIPSHVYPVQGSVSFNDSASMAFEPVLPAQIGTQTVFCQIATTGGTSSASGTQPPWATTVGNTARDGDLLWMNLGSATWSAGRTVSQWTGNTTPFTAIFDTITSTWQVCIAGGVTAGTAPTFNSTYGQQTPERSGSAIWMCVGTGINWAASTQWYLPVGGFAPPQPGDQPYGGSIISDTNSNVEAAISSGKSGSTHPTWNTNLNGTTQDPASTGTLFWRMIGAYQQNSLSWTVGHVYSYSFKARSSSDFFVANTPPGQSSPLGPPTGSGTGTITTASPVFTITGSNSGSVNTVTGLGSTDTQYDTIVIWRDADGGGSSNMFELTEIPAPKPIGGVAQPWSFQDFLPDVATSLFPGLNVLLPAPNDDVNDGPPADFLPMSWHFQRIWGVTQGNQVVFSGGPDTLVGNPSESFNPSDQFPFESNVTRLQHTSAGLITFTSTDIEIIAGGPQTASFYSTTLAAGIGLASYNAADVFAGEIYFYSSGHQFMALSPNLSVSELGFPVQNDISTFNPAETYLAVLQAENDNCIFLGDGSSRVFRNNPRQSPDQNSTWSPVTQYVGGTKMLQSIQIAWGEHELLVGSTQNNQTIGKRDTSVFTDRGSAYPAYFTIGSLVLCAPSQVAVLGFVEADFAGVGNYPKVRVLMNEVSGAFTEIPFTGVFDPPLVYGDSQIIVPESYFPLRYQFSSIFDENNIPRVARHLMLQFDFGTNQVGNELWAFSLYGRILQQN